MTDVYEGFEVGGVEVGLGVDGTVAVVGRAGAGEDDSASTRTGAATVEIGAGISTCTIRGGFVDEIVTGAASG